MEERYPSQLWLLATEKLQELGNVNPNWFEDLTKKSKEKGLKDTTADRLSEKSHPGGIEEQEDVDWENPSTDCSAVGKGCNDDTIDLQGKCNAGECFQPVGRSCDLALEEAAGTLPASVSPALSSAQGTRQLQQVDSDVRPKTEGAGQPGAFPSPTTLEGTTEQQNTTEVGNIAMVTATPTTTVSASTFTTPAFSPWPNSGDRKSILEDSSEDLDVLLARMLDSEGGVKEEAAVLVDSSYNSQSCSEGKTDHTNSIMTEGHCTGKGFMKKLLMAKSVSTERKGSTNHMIRALGIDPNASGLSWTSSLATPPVRKDFVGGSAIKTEPLSVTASTEEEWPTLMGAARKLFCNEDSQEGEDISSLLDSTTGEEVDAIAKTLPVLEQRSREVKDVAWPLCTESTPESLTWKDGLRGRTAVDKMSPVPVVSLCSPVCVPTVAELPEPKLTKSEEERGVSKSRDSLPEDPQAKAKRYDELLEGLFDTPPSRTSFQKFRQKRILRSSRRDFHFDDDPFLDLLNQSTAEKRCGSGKGLKRKKSNPSSSDESASSMQSLGFEALPGECDMSLRRSDESPKTPAQEVVQCSSEKTAGCKVLSGNVGETPNLAANEEPRVTPEVTFKTPGRMSERRVGNQNAVEGKLTRSSSVSDGDDLFSQLSPTVLSAICEVASGMEQDETTCQESNSNLKFKTPEKFCDKHEDGCSPSKTLASNSIKVAKTDVTDQGTDREGKKVTNSNAVGDVSHSSEVFKRSSSSGPEGNDELFSQLSPMSLESILLATDNPSRKEGHLGIHQDESPSLGKAAATAENAGKVCEELEQPAPRNQVPETCGVLDQGGEMTKKTTSQAKPFGIRKKAKRFSYPTSSQIAKLCPEEVYQLQATQNKKYVDISSEKSSVQRKEPKGTQTSDSKDGKAKDIAVCQPENSLASINSSKPYLRRSGAGFTNLSLYMKNNPNHVQLIDGQSGLGDSNSNMSEPVIASSISNFKDKSALEDNSMVHHLQKTTSQHQAGAATFNACATPRGRDSASLFYRLPEWGSSATGSKSEQVQLKEITVSKFVEERVTDKPDVSHQEPEVNSSGDSQLRMDEVEDEFNKDFFHDFTEETAVRETGPGRPECKEIKKVINVTDGQFDSSSNMSEFGFHSAAGTKINVSTAAVAKYSRWFDECSEAVDKDMVMEKSVAETEHAAGSRGSSEELSTLIFEGKVQRNPESIPSASALCGFKKASGKIISVSDQSLKKVCSLFDDLDSPVDIAKSRHSLLPEPQKPFNPHSKSLPNLKETDRKVLQKDTDSKKYTLKKVHQGDIGCDQLDQNVYPNSGPDGTQILPEGKVLPAVVGFQTARGRNLKVSAEAVAKYSKLFEDELSSSARDRASPEVGKVGFCTAGGRSLRVSAAAVAKYSSIFDENEKLQEEDKDFALGRTVSTDRDRRSEVGLKSASLSGCKEDEAVCMLSAAPGVGFMTAAGKCLEVSSEAVAKYSKLFMEDDPQTVEDLNGVKVVDETKVLPGSLVGQMGFRTAGGCEVKVSGAALMKYSTWFEEDIEPDGVGLHYTKSTSDTKRFQSSGSPHKPAAKEKDYSKLPKGFRPFKRPRMVTSTKSNASSTVSVNKESGSLNAVPSSPKVKSPDECAKCPNNEKRKIDNLYRHTGHDPSNISGYASGDTARDTPLNTKEDEPVGVNTTDIESGYVEELSNTQREAQDCAAALLWAEEEYGEAHGFTQAAQESAQAKMDSAEAEQESAQAKMDCAEAEPESAQAKMNRAQVDAFSVGPTKRRLQAEWNSCPAVPDMTLAVKAEPVMAAVTDNTERKHVNKSSDFYSQRIKEENVKDSHPQTNLGFQTASGKKCKISDDALQKARALMDAEDSTTPLTFSLGSTAEEISGAQPLAVGVTSLPSVKEGARRGDLPCGIFHKDGPESGAEGQFLSLKQVQLKNEEPKNHPRLKSGFYAAGTTAMHQESRKSSRKDAHEIEVNQNEHRRKTGEAVQEEEAEGNGDSPEGAATGMQIAAGELQAVHLIRLSQLAVDKSQNIVGELQSVPTLLPDPKNVSPLRSNIQEVPQGNQLVTASVVLKMVEPAEGICRKEMCNGVEDNSIATPPEDIFRAVQGASPEQIERGTSPLGLIKEVQGRIGTLSEPKSVPEEKDPIGPAQEINLMPSQSEHVDLSLCCATTSGILQVHGHGRVPGSPPGQRSDLKKSQPSQNEPQPYDAVVPEKDSVPGRRLQTGMFLTERQFSFTTASGKHVPVSDDALSRAKSILCGIEDCAPDTIIDPAGQTDRTGQTDGPESKKTDLESGLLTPLISRAVDEGQGDGPRNVSVGFQSASGKRVAISEKALKYVKGMFDSADTVAPVTGYLDRGDSNNPVSAVNVSNSGVCEMKRTKPGDGHKFQGFCTASGSRVTVSVQALREAKKLLNDSHDISKSNESSTGLGDSINFTEHSFSAGKDKVDCTVFSGFQTASGAKVDIKADSLERARKVLQDEHHSDEVNPGTVDSGAGPPGALAFQGFTTARGTKVVVSSQALVEAQKLLSEVGSEQVGSLPDSSLSRENNTGSSVSLRKTKDPLPEISNLNGAQSKARDSGKRFDLLTENQRKQIFEETLPHKSSSFVGFETAKGNKVSISAKALKAAQQLMAQVEGDAPQEKVSLSIGVKGPGESPRRKVSEGEKTQGDKIEANLGSNGPEQYDAVMVELSESTAALLADGDEAFGEELDDVSQGRDNQDNSATLMLGQEKGQQKQEGKSTPGRTSGCTWRRAVITTPDGLTTDRPLMRQSTVHSPIVTAPFGDNTSSFKVTGMRWLGETGNTSSVTHQAYRGDDRAGFFSPICHSAGPVEPAGSRPSLSPIVQSTPTILRRTSFSAPYRKTPEPGVAVQSNQSKGSVKQKIFRTPLKTKSDDAPSSTSFKTPTKAPNTVKQKRTLSDAENVSPLKKKMKTEEAVNDTGGTDADWGSMEDFESISEAMDSAEQAAKEAQALEVKAVKIVNDAADQVVHSSGSDSADLKAQETGACPGQNSQTTIATPDTKCSKEGLDYVVEKSQRVSEAVVKQRLKAKVAQGQRIRKKKEEGGVRPRPGRLFMMKGNRHRLPLRAAVYRGRPQSYPPQQLYACGVRASTSNIKASTAEHFMFTAFDHYSEEVALSAESVTVGDGALLVWDSQSRAGKDEFCNALLDLAEVDPKLISREWVFNHYRWIVWKLAAMEASFPHVFRGRCLTPDQVMLQLKYRYDREVDNSHRSAIKKIVERDDTPARTLILCVSSLGQGLVSTNTGQGSDTSSAKQIANDVMTAELTDGWYSLPAVFDPALTRLARGGRLVAGDKVCVYGAELVGSQDAASPLEVSSDTMLKICANSTRRARWDARLGYHRNPQPPPLPLNSLYPDGGMAGCVDVIITRLYPLQFMERHPDGSTVFRTDRAEQKASRVFEMERQRHLEGIYAKLQAEFEAKAACTDRRRTRQSGCKITQQDIEKLTTGQEIHDMIVSATDPGTIEGGLCDQQRALLTDHRRHLQEELHSEMQAEFKAKLEKFEEKKPKRNVVPLIKVRLAGCATRDIDSSANSLLTVWRPSEDIREMFVEGKRFYIYNVMAAEGRGRMKNNGVALTAQRMTRYREMPVDDNFLDLVYEPREVTAFSELTEHYQPAYSEVDMVGLVIHVSQITSFDKASGAQGQVQTVYLADCDQNLAGIKTWGGIAVYSLEEVLKPGVAVALTNLQWKVDSIRGRLPTVVLTEMSTASTNPRESHLQIALSKMRASTKAENNFVTKMQQKLHTVTAVAPVSGAQNLLEQSPRVSTPPATLYSRTPLSRSRGATNVYRTPRNVTYPQQTTPTHTSSPSLSVSETDMSRFSDNGGQTVPRDDQGLQAPTTDKRKTVNGSGHAEILTALSAGPDKGFSHSDSMSIKHCDKTSSATIQESVEDMDPLVAKKKALQKSKAVKLAQYGDSMPVTPLHTPISRAVRKAFKAPTMTPPAASPALSNVQKSRKQPAQIKEPSVNSLAEKASKNSNFEVKLDRKLDYNELDDLEAQNSPKQDSGCRVERVAPSESSCGNLQHGILSSQEHDSVSVVEPHQNNCLSEIDQGMALTEPTVSETREVPALSGGRRTTRGKRSRTNSMAEDEMKSKRRSSLRLLKQKLPPNSSK